MFEYRQVLVRLRQGDSERDIARARLMGRHKAARFRFLAERCGWLDAACALPSDAEIAVALQPARRAASTISSLQAHQQRIADWHRDGVNGVVIHATLAREHGYTGSYSSVYRMLSTLGKATPPDATVRLTFPPAEAAQVDFGAGPVLWDAEQQRTRVPGALS